MYQQLLEHTAMLQQQQQQQQTGHLSGSGVGFPGLNRLPTASGAPLGVSPTAAGLLSWHQPPPLPPQLDEVNGEFSL